MNNTLYETETNEPVLELGDGHHDNELLSPDHVKLFVSRIEPHVDEHALQKHIESTQIGKVVHITLLKHKIRSHRIGNTPFLAKRPFHRAVICLLWNQNENALFAQQRLSNHQDIKIPHGNAHFWKITPYEMRADIGA